MTVPSSPSAAAAAAPAAPAAAAITAHLPQLPLELQRVSHRTRPESLTIEPPNPLWPVHYERLRDRIQSALGPGTALLSIAHVGSTSIPGLFAKPVIDIDIVVADPADEGSYVAALVGKGWEETGTGRGRGQEAEGEGEGEADAGGVGLQFLFREPAWYDHRFFVREDGEGEPKANVHVFGPGCPEVVRHRIFKEWLLEHPEDREKYAATKREACKTSQEAGESVMEYNLRKEPVIQEILDRAFRAHGLLE